MRDTTKIRALAQETIDDLSKLDQTDDVKNAVENQKEIIRVAQKIERPNETRPQPPTKKGS